MGQKIHPGGFRVGYIQDWKSNWFDEKGFADVLEEDLKIRDHIEGKLFIDYIAPLKKRLLKKKLDDISSGKVKVDYRMIFPK